MQNTELHIIDFKTQSIVATFQDHDYWDDMREWELKNNVDILEFKVFDGTRQAITLQQQNLVLRQDREGNVIPYTIEDECEKTAKDRSITVRAVGAWTGLRKAGYIRPQRLEALTAHQYVSLATAGTKWQPGNIEYASFRTMTLDEFTDPLTLLKKVATLFNLELQYRVEVDGNQVIGWFVDLVEKVGRVTRKEIKLGKDLINITRIEHTKNVCTALVGFARGEDNEMVTIEGINAGSPYIVDNEAFQRWSENGQHKYGFYQPETEGEIDAKRLMTLMKTEMEKRKNSSVGYEVDALDIAEVFGLRHELIMKGDTIGIKDTAFTPALYLEARAIGGKESNSNPDRNKYSFGEYHEIVDYDAEMRKMYNRVQGLLENKAGKPLLDQLNKLVQEQEKKITEVVETNERVTEITEKLEEMVTNNSVTMHDGPNAPTEGLKEGKSLWLDTSNGKPGILKIWRGGKWEAVTEDFSGLEKEIRDQVAKDVDEKTKQLNKSISDMEIRAGEAEKKAEALEKRATDLESKNGTLESKANALEKKTTTLETKANDLDKEVTTLKGGYDSLDKITKEIKETERGTQETLKQLKVDGEKVDQTIVEIGKSLDGFNQSISQIKKDAEETNKTVVKQQQTIDGFTTEIGNLKKTDTEINETLVKQQQSITGFTSEISNLKKTDAELKETNVKQQQTLDGFTTDITEMKKTDAELKETNVKHQQSINGFTNEISNLKKKDTEINETLVKQQQSLTGFTNEVNNLKKTDKEINETLTKHQQSLTGFTNEISNLKKTDTEINQTLVKQQQTLNGFSNEVSELKKTDAELKETTVKQEQSIKGISNSIAEVNKNISGQSQKINTLESTVDGNKKLIQSVEKDLTATKNDFSKTTTEIKEEAGKIATKLEKVEARTVGGENWLINTGPNERPQTIGMVGGASVNKAGSSFHEDYMIIECTDHTDSFYQFHLDNTKMGDFEKGKDMTLSVDLQNDVHVDLLVFQFINGSWSENLQTGFPAGDWSRRSFTFQIDGRATGWGMRLRFARSDVSKGKRFRFKRPKLEKGSIPTDFSKSTYELEQSFNGVKERIESVEVKTNDVGDRNYVRNGDFSHYWADNGTQWDKNLNGNLRAGNWSTGYNSGTTEPTKGYHMHVNDKKFGYPVVAVINKNGPIVGAKRWLGMSQVLPKSFVNDFQPGDTYTIAVDVWTETANNKLAIGFHHFIVGNNTQSFYSGCPELTINPVKKWVRIHFTRKLDDKTDMSKAFNLYFYGDRSNDGSECYFKNVSVLKGSMPKAFAPSPEDGVKEVLFNEKVTEITKDADGIKTNVKNITDLTTKHGQRITQSETSLKQLSDEVSAKMTSKQVEDYVAGVGATNILRNAGLRTDIKTLYFGLTPGTVVDTGSKFSSQNTFWSVKTGRTADDWAGAISNPYPCQAGEDFVASIWFVTDNVASIDNGAYMEIEYFNASGTRIATAREKLDVKTVWQRATLVVKTPANTVNIKWRFYIQKNGRLRTALPMLQRGKVASEFQLNPADISDVDELREDIAQRIATEEFNKVVTQINREIKANKDGILIKADANKVYTKQESDGTFAKESHVKTLESKIQVNERNISLSVKENDIISKINMSKETISIEARRINLIGFVTAQHIKGSVLEGVTLKTAKGNANRWVELNEQNINLYDGNVNRMYMGFYNSGNNVQPSISLGRGSTGDLTGTLFIHQTTPGGNQWANTFGRIGIVHRVENGDLLMNASIEFQRDGGHMIQNAWGGWQVKCNNNLVMETNDSIVLKTNWQGGAKNINLEPTSNMWVMAHNEVWMQSNQAQNYHAGNGKFDFRRKGHGKPGVTLDMSSDWDADIKFGTNVILRASNHDQYLSGMQVKNYNGSGFVDIEVRDVKHHGRISQMSLRRLKQSIRDVDFDSLDKIMSLDLKSYYMKTEIEKLYEMRVNRKEGDPLPTMRDIDISYGFIVETIDKVFQTPKGDAVDIYALNTIHIDATQNINCRLVVAEETIKDQDVVIENQNDRISNLETKLEQVLELLGKE
ncbi:phage tail spike protein [Bacillus mycoides]|uniref:phage tail spike protein n=1 Tax=Bacillus mycoides TaxID=1405 RepID=UPI003D6627DC